MSVAVVVALVAAAAPVIDRPVTDLAGAVGARSDAVERDLRDLRERTGVQMAVLVVDSTGGVPIEDFSHDAASAWGGGSKDASDGVLFVLALGDRRMRLEVGRGLEGAIPDGVAARIVDGAVPFLRGGDVAGAVESVVSGVKERVRDLRPGAPRPSPPLVDLGPFQPQLALFGRLLPTAWWSLAVVAVTVNRVRAAAKRARKAKKTADDAEQHGWWLLPLLLLVPPFALPLDEAWESVAVVVAAAVVGFVLGRAKSGAGLWIACFFWLAVVCGWLSAVAAGGDGADFGGFLAMGVFFGAIGWCFFGLFLFLLSTILGLIHAGAGAALHDVAASMMPEGGSSSGGGGGGGGSSWSSSGADTWSSSSSSGSSSSSSSSGGGGDYGGGGGSFDGGGSSGSW